MAVNVELLQKTLDAIKANPQHWDQTKWHCNTSHCFAGFAELISNNMPIDTDSEVLESDANFADMYTTISGGYAQTVWLAQDNARDLLGISVDDAGILFAGYNSLSDLEDMVQHLIDHGSLDEFQYADSDEDDK